MGRLQSNGIELEYEEFGHKNRPAIVMVGGWSVQLTFWPKQFIDNLVDAGFRVIVFDNRDVGLSEKIRFPATSPLAPHVLLSRVLKVRGLTAYTLEDMADDTIGVFDALNIERGHILGLSMGGMISQIVAAKYADRIETATILMSSTNRIALPQPPLELSASVLLSRGARNSEEGRKRSERIWRKIRTQDGGYDDDEFRAGISATIDRSFAPSGRRRQLEAVVATGDLRKWTKRIAAPTLVIHGGDDLLSRPHGGLDIAANIPDAQFELIPGMGHDLPPNRIEEISALVTDHLDRRSQRRPQSTKRYGDDFENRSARP